MHRVTVSTRNKNNSGPRKRRRGKGSAANGGRRRETASGTEGAGEKGEKRYRKRWRGRKKERERKRERESRCYVSPSTMGKIFSLMNQDECTPVPITLQPRSPYFALLDFCHFKANEMLERQGRWERAAAREGGTDGLPRKRGLRHGSGWRSMLSLVPSRLVLSNKP